MPHAIYGISGSPCCGKSTVAELLTRRHGLHLYSLDEELGRMMKLLAREGNALCRRMLKPWDDGTWAPDPRELCREQERLYEAIFPMVWQEISALAEEKPVLAEGAGLMPVLLQMVGVPPGRCLCMIPTWEFQWEHYSKRDWVDLFLQNCTRPDLAFRRWMERDCLFAARRQKEAQALGHPVLLVDGTLRLEQTLARAQKALGLA